MKKANWLREDRPVSSMIKCRFKDCRFDTDVDSYTEAKIAIDTKLHLVDLHVQAEHVPAPAQPAPAQPALAQPAPAQPALA